MSHNVKDINLIVIHTADTPPTFNGGAKDIDRWHKEKGWSGIGYHFVILKNGKIEYGRPISEMGAHTQGRNENSIGICWIGGSRGLDDRTEDQKCQIQSLVASLLQVLPSFVRVRGHRDFTDKKQCPNFDVIEEFSPYEEDQLVWK
jgi:N-acetylmuramoyl-L-alanine amidase